jgi:formate-dependent nitrite reductase membrane component NrfD
MTSAPSSTFFTAPPDWQWLIILYFFVGGLAGGSYFLAVLIDMFGPPADRRLARLGYYVAFPGVVVSGLLLTVDLRRPERFWHMLLQSETLRPMFKPWSPMSVGSWALLAFGTFAFVGFLAALAESGRLRWSWLTALRPPRPLGVVVGVLGGLLAFFVAGYTGVLLAVTNRPIWSDSPLLGLLFVVSAASTSAALLLLLGRTRRIGVPGLEALERFGDWVMVLELLVLIAFVVSLGRVASVWLSGWGVVLLLGVVLAGLVVPLWLEWRPRPGRGLRLEAAPVLVLVGGFILRVVIILASEAV